MNSKNLFCIEIGNSNIHGAVFDKNNDSSNHIKISHSEISLLPWDEIKERYSPVVFTGEVTHIRESLIEILIDKNIDHFEMNHKNQTLIKDTYPTLGIDRICNLIGALSHKPPTNNPIIVFDFGTATTATACDTNGTFLGGTIMPGFEMALSSLSTRTFTLPHIELARECKIQELNPLAKSTDLAMLQGVIISQASFIKHYLELFKEKEKNIPKVIITGGNAEIITRFFNDYDLYDPHLTLKGLYHWSVGVMQNLSHAK